MLAGLPMRARTFPRPVSLVSLLSFAILGGALLGCAAKEAVSPQSPVAIVPDGPAPAESEPTKAALEEQLSAATIQSVMRESYDQFRACYEAGLARDATLAGLVLVRFVITHSGNVHSIELVERGSDEGPSTDLPDREVLDCLLGAYRQIEFPAFRSGEMTVVYPIRFSRE